MHTIFLNLTVNIYDYYNYEDVKLFFTGKLIFAGDIPPRRER